MITETQIQKCRIYCKDSIDKIPGYYEALNSTGPYVVHHVNELTINGEFAHSHEDLKRLDMYYHRPYFELIFLPRDVHRRIHMCSKGRSPNYKDMFTPAVRKKLSDRRKKRIPPALGHKHTEEAKAKIREASLRYWHNRKLK